MYLHLDLPCHYQGNSRGCCEVEKSLNFRYMNSRYCQSVCLSCRTTIYARFFQLSRHLSCLSYHCFNNDTEIVVVSSSISALRKQSEFLAMYLYITHPLPFHIFHSTFHSGLKRLMKQLPCLSSHNVLLFHLFHLGSARCTFSVQPSTDRRNTSAIYRSIYKPPCTFQRPKDVQWAG